MTARRRETHDGAQRPFTIIDNELIGALTPMEINVYLHIKRRAGGHGECWESLAHMAEEAQVSTGSLKKALKSLVRQNLISKVRRPGGTDVYSLTPPNEWMLEKSIKFCLPNMDQICLGGGSNLSTEHGSNLSTNKIPFKIDPNKNTQERLVSMAEPDPLGYQKLTSVHMNTALCVETSVFPEKQQDRQFGFRVDEEQPKQPEENIIPLASNLVDSNSAESMAFSEISPVARPSLYCQARVSASSGDVPQDLLDAVLALRFEDNAAVMQDAVVLALKTIGFSCRKESPAEYSEIKGRIDILATRGGVEVGIECDRATPRKKSLIKLEKNHPDCYVVFTRYQVATPQTQDVEPLTKSSTLMPKPPSLLDSANGGKFASLLDRFKSNKSANPKPSATDEDIELGRKHAAAMAAVQSERYKDEWMDDPDKDTPGVSKLDKEAPLDIFVASLADELDRDTLLAIVGTVNEPTPGQAPHILAERIWDTYRQWRPNAWQEPAPIEKSRVLRMAVSNLWRKIADPSKSTAENIVDIELRFRSALLYLHSNTWYSSPEFGNQHLNYLLTLNRNGIAPFEKYAECWDTVPRQKKCDAQTLAGKLQKSREVAANRILSEMLRMREIALSTDPEVILERLAKGDNGIN